MRSCSSTMCSSGGKAVGDHGRREDRCLTASGAMRTEGKTVQARVVPVVPRSYHDRICCDFSSFHIWNLEDHSTAL